MIGKWKDVVLDIETDAVLDGVTSKLHCLVLRDVDSGAVLSCADQPGFAPFADGVRVLERAERVYGHNIIRFDRPQLAKHTGHLIPWEKVRDTLVIAGMRWTDLKETDIVLAQRGRLPSDLIGKNSLEAWGYRLGVRKAEFGRKPAGKRKNRSRNENTEEDILRWAEWSPEMQSYCEQDTEVTRALVLHIRKAGVSPLAVETEQELAVYLDAQEQNGWPFDLERAVELQAKLAARREEISSELKRVFGSWYKPVKKDGEVVVFTAKRPDRKRGLVAGAQYTKVELVEFNPASRQHIADRLQKLYGWKPTKFTPSGQPEVNEHTLKALPQDLPGVALLSEYLLVQKRLGQLAEGDNAWLKLATRDRRTGGKLTGMYHVHGVCLQNGTITHRATHIYPNLAQVPAVGVPYGEECRGLFRVPDGWVQIGADASGLELRELSHYMARWDGGAYGKVVTEGRNEDGTDVHSVNRDALGLEGKEGRKDAKTFIYAFLYGSGDLNLGRLIPPKPHEIEEFKADTKTWRKTKQKLAERQEPTDDFTTACVLKGAKLRATFLKNLPALNDLITAVKHKAKTEGRLKLHDGRYVPVRHQHAALNSLLQGSGAIVCKRWIVRFARRLTAEFGPQGWGGKWAALGWIHDEVQLAVRPEIADRVKEILVEEIRAVAAEFNMRIDLDGEAKSGRNWAETH